jgi:hypothetical protein
MNSNERQAVARRMLFEAIDTEKIGAVHLREGLLLALKHSESAEDIVFWLAGYFGMATELFQATGGIAAAMPETSPETSL